MAANPAPRRGGVFFPILLIAAGLLALAMNFGWVDASLWVDLLALWPVLLIGLGLSIMLGGSRVGAALAAIVTLALLAGGVAWLQQRAPETAFAPEAIDAPAAGVRSATIRLAPGAADVRVGALAGGSPSLIAGTAGAGRGRPLDPSFDVADGKGRFELVEPPSTSSFGLADLRGRRWDLDVARGVPLRLEVNAGVGRLDLDLVDVTLTALDLDLGVGEVVATLPGKGRYAVDVDGGVGAITLRLPEGLAARIDADAGLGAVDVPSGFRKVDDHVWETDGYSDADDRVTIDVDGGVGAVDIDVVDAAAR